MLTRFFLDSDLIVVLQAGFGSGFLPLGSGLESDSKKLDCEHLWWQGHWHDFCGVTLKAKLKKNVCAAEVAGLNFSDSHSAPVPKFLYPGPCPVIFQIWKSDSCSDPGYYHHGSNWNLPTFLLNKWQHRRLLLPKLKSDPGSGHCVSQIFDSRIRVWKKRRILPESTPVPWSPLAWRRAAPQS